MDEDDAILLAALEMSERQRAERAGPWQPSAGRAPERLSGAPERVQATLLVCEDSGLGSRRWGAESQRAAAQRDTSRLQQQRLPFAPSGARPEAHKPSLLAQNAATLAYEREVQARCKAAAVAQRHDQEIERQKALMHGPPGGATSAGGRGARCGEAPARSQSLLCPKAPALHVRPALFLEHDRRPNGVALTPAGLDVEKAKTLYIPSSGREYQRYEHARMSLKCVARTPLAPACPLHRACSLA